MRTAAVTRRLLACAFLALGLVGGAVRAADQVAPAQPKFSWTLKAIPGMSRGQAQPIPVSVAIGPVAATRVMVLQAALVERNTRQPLAPAGLHLCRSAVTACTGEPLDLPASSAAALWLWGGDGIGVFEGSVTLASLEKPEGDQIAMIVNSSNAQHKTLGVLAILLSVVLTWLLTVVVRSRANRKQLLLPASIVLHTLNDIRSRVEAGHKTVPVPRVVQRVEEVQQQLSIPALAANGLPSSLPAAGPTPAALGIDAYRKHVQAQSDWTQALAILVREGLEPSWERWQHAPDDATRARLGAAIASIDALSHAATAPSADALRLAIRSIFAALDAAGLKGVPQPPGHLGIVGTPEQLLVQIAGLGAAGWFFLLLVTTLGGAYVLVLGPAGAGFGTITDYAQCLLWGAGLPAGAQLMQSTTGSIATSFGVTR